MEANSEINIEVIIDVRIFTAPILGNIKFTGVFCERLEIIAKQAVYLRLKYLSILASG